MYNFISYKTSLETSYIPTCWQTVTVVFTLNPDRLEYKTI